MATATTAASERIGDLLVREGLISQDQLKKALEDAQSSGTRVGFSLIKLGFIAEEDLTRTLARQYRVPAVDLNRVTIDPKIIDLVKGEHALKYQVLPLRRVGRTLTVAMANPADARAIDDLKFLTRHDIEPVVVGEYTLKKHLEKYYETADERIAELLQEVGADSDEVEVVQEQEEEVSVAALQAQVGEAPIVKLVNGILTDAVLRGASDIHIEPFEKELRVRYRIDGSLQEI
ncbi:MAG: type II secretion system protein GspE, partial [Gemmatimonadetes bacterium]|nr:type II secretion system protein GspE [Gemmatimonadota bacterium]